ncbi:hypothetical protein [Algibacter sp. L4_22]|uniref:hypothetical protein n=1 Tax=Algibacter sp. L4_22 TaxID=2942477 RepID=UPI00201B8D67|nr:hypothetical protein [Algibacter sp. L4_22]MCL5128483.1 hypothetical protein [Algibacter sp. L4_22]
MKLKSPLFKSLLFTILLVCIALTSCEDDDTSDDCFKPSFTTEHTSGTTYVFSPEFEILNGTEIKEGYILKFFVDGEYKYQALGAAWDEGEFRTTLEPGSHEICFELTTNDCSETRNSCETIEVGDCFNPDFTISLFSEGYYQIKPDFELLNGTSIKEGYILKYYLDNEYKATAWGEAWDQGNFFV